MREQIQGMPVGRELDALVCEKVFDLQVTWEMDEWTDPYPLDERGIIVDYFSADISAAWEVLEKFHEVTVKRFKTIKGHRYWCKIELTYDGEPIIAQGDSAPEAISKAALLAVIEE